MIRIAAHQEPPALHCGVVAGCGDSSRFAAHARGASGPAEIRLEPARVLRE